MGIINLSILKKLPLIKPPLKLQQRFSEAIEKVASLETKQLDSIEKIKGLQEELVMTAFNYDKSK